MSKCCFTGHRDLGDSARRVYQRTCEVLETLIKNGYTEFRAGGALGFDTVAAMAVLEAKKRHPHIRLVLYIPCRDQDRGWSLKNRQRYQRILQQADEVKVLSEQYYRGCMFVRNRAMVDGSTLCLAYMTHPTGGTKMTVDYAKRKDITVINMGELL